MATVGGIGFSKGGLSLNGGSIITGTVENYDALPPASDHANETWATKEPQGYRILGTFKNRGLWRSDGTVWKPPLYVNPATLATVNTGTGTDEYVSPETLQQSEVAIQAKSLARNFLLMGS